MPGCHGWMVFVLAAAFSADFFQGSYDRRKEWINAYCAAASYKVRREMRLLAVANFPMPTMEALRTMFRKDIPPPEERIGNHEFVAQLLSAYMLLRLNRLRHRENKSPIPLPLSLNE